MDVVDGNSGRYFRLIILFYLLWFDLMVIEGNWGDLQADGFFGIFPDFSIFNLKLFVDKKLKLFVDKI
jgi:hypothetical protein